jgi:hypothetical protein
MSASAAKTNEVIEQTTEMRANFRISILHKYLANTPGGRAALQFAVWPFITPFKVAQPPKWRGLSVAFLFWPRPSR